MPTARYAFAVGVCDGQMLAAGGQMRRWLGIFGKKRTAETEAYAPEMNEWTRKSPLPSPRSYAGACTVGERLYVIGGKDRYGVTPDCKVLNVTTDVWARGPALAEARSSPGVASVDGTIYAVGGEAQVASPITEVLPVSATFHLHEKKGFPVEAEDDHESIRGAHHRNHQMGAEGAGRD